ncbi:MAG TPA: LytTR family DNA-binding domain-containing protein [Chryseosolibacter sp.]|nr:LytTR family DNA-binding domain-containing protein [Chryseosolibacter sp.]
MNCLIIDDEPIARKGLEEYVRDIEFLHLVGQCDNPLKASGYLTEHQIDLIFLDIHMPRITGIDFLKTLRNPPLVIFTTAFPQYALEGYALDVTDYLVKPITFERFLKAAQKAYEVFSLKRLATQPREGSDYFFVKCDSKFEKVFFKDVLFIESLQNYVVINTVERKLIAYITLSGIEAQLPKDQFIKVHKSFIISVPHVKAIEANEIIIREHRIPISRNLKDEVVEQILGNKLFKRK